MDSLIPSTLKIDKTVLSLVPCFDTSDEKLYWLSRTPTERLQHIEVLRRINYGHHATARLQEFLRLLNTHGVEYLLIGGYAVGYHGYPRATNDMDIWIAIHSQNAERIVATIDEVDVSLISLYHLKVNKQASGRYKDLDDLEHLP